MHDRKSLFTEMLAASMVSFPRVALLGRAREPFVTGRKTVSLARNAVLFGLALCFAAPALSRTAAADPAQLISDFRLKHGEKRVTLDAALTRIAHDQAQAMAAKDQLDHDVLGRFNTRVGPAGAGRAAENIAYGYDSFPKTLDQWINSSGHRKNLLLAGATRVGVASVKSAKTGRMYWAMVIAATMSAQDAARVHQRVRQRLRRRSQSRPTPRSPNRTGRGLPAEDSSLCF